MQTIAVLITCFNRKEKTLKCLECLYAQLPIDGNEVDVYLTNDGCTDGTPEAVRERFPAVQIIDGNGNLYWNRGMYTAWKKAAETREYDFYLWLNDDTYLMEGAIEEMLSNSKQTYKLSAIVAPMRSALSEVTTYSGFINDKKINPNGTLQECHTFHGNCVLIPSAIFKQVGNLDWTFRHAIGDLDYGYRIRRSGFKSHVSTKYLGICENNPKLPVWARKEIPFRQRIKNLYSPLGYAEPIPFFHHELKNFGILTALKHFITIHIRVCFPSLWK